MLSRRALLTVSRLSRSSIRPRTTPPTAPFSTARCLQAEPDPDVDDPDMNGGYVNPPFVKRQHRDPYADWWDKQERRNFGEPLHEDNDILGMFSLYDYTHMTVGRGLLMWGGFISIVLGLSFTVSNLYPDRPSAPKEYEGGLEKEMGGKGAVRARMAGDPV